MRFCLLVVAWLALARLEAATGPIIVDPDFPRSFRYTSGERFFPMGDTAYFLIAQPTNVIARYIDVRQAHHFNFIRAMAMADGFWPFGGTPNKPDYSTINEIAMQKWDWVFDYAQARNVNIELILWGYGIGGGEGLWGRQSDQDFWISTLVNRFKDRKNLFMYTVANEFERYPDGKYQYDPADVEWARSVAARIRKIDSTHPIGCHPSVWITDQDAPNKGPRPFAHYKDFTQLLPQVVWPLWEGSAINLDVTQNNEGVQPRTWGNLDGGRRGLTYYPTTWQGVEYPVNWTASGWDFEAPGLEDSLADEWMHGKPVLNTEFGYQNEPGYEQGANYTTRQTHQPSTVRKKAWKIATSGAHFSAGFESAAVRQFNSTDVDNFRPEQLEALYLFFTTRTEYWKMAPHLESVASQNVLLALPGQEYVAYFPRGGTNYVKLSAGSYTTEWLHPESGGYFQQGIIAASDGVRDFVPPERPKADWVLHLRKEDVPEHTASRFSQEILRGESFLTNLFDTQLDLLPEFKDSRTYWLFHDNYLADRLLESSRPDLSSRIRASLVKHGITNSGKIEILFGEAEHPLPFRNYLLTNVTSIEGKTIRTEIVTTNILAGWQDYADLLLLAGIAEAGSNPRAARTAFDRAEGMWDGQGLNDRATQHNGIHSTYKLALYLLAASHLKISAAHRDEALERLLSLQSPSGGWITDYKDNKPHGLANVETTCLVLLALRML